MSRILVLAESGFGKSTSLGNIPGLGIKGLDPKETLIIGCSDKSLPFPNWKSNYKQVTKATPEGNYVVTNNPDVILKTVDHFLMNRPEIKNYVFDDFNFIMQDYYMENAKSKGYDVFKNIGYDIGQIFKKFTKINLSGNNVIVLAHPHIEEINDVAHYKMKTVGNMVDQYVTPMGKFEIVLMGKEEFDDRTKTVKKYFVTSFDGDVRGKAPYGMFKDVYVPNDMDYIITKIKEYEDGDGGN